jgi:hypothetical protein
MGDDGNSGGNNNISWANTSSQNTTGPNPVIAPRLESVGNDFWSWYGKNANAPAYYPGSTVAPENARRMSALTGTWQRGAATPFITDPAYGFIKETMGGKYLDPNQNPAFQDFLSASFRPQTEQLTDVILPSIDAKFAGAGRTAGGAHIDTTMRGVNDLNRAQADAASKVGLGLYQGERDKQFQAMSFLPQLQNMDFQGIAALQQAAAEDQGYDQRKVDADIARYNYGQTAQPDWYARMANIIQSIYPGGQTNSSGSSTGYSPSAGGGGGGGFGSMLGPLMSLGGGAMSMFGGGGGGMFSDERLKDDIKPVGKLDDGQTVYSYRYKGDPRTQIGLLAQEVEKVHPEAVSTHPSGYKMVRYDMAMPEGGLI